MNELYKELKKYGEVKLNEPMKKHSTMQVGGLTNYFITVKETDKIVDLLNYLSGVGVPYLVVGSGSNLLFPDEPFEGVMICLQNRGLVAEGEMITAEAGAFLAGLVNLAADKSLAGLSWAVGIPGTVGGAVRGNAGAMGGSTGTSVEEVIAWVDGEVRVFKQAECGFAYRSSIFKASGAVILKTIFKLSPGEQAEIKKEMATYLSQRLARHTKWPSCGSFFQNIKLADWPGDPEALPATFRERSMVPVGYLVEQLGLKDLRIGGAGIAPEHGNFVVNFGDATQADILAVVDTVKEKVYNKYGVNLVPEVEIVSF